MTGNREPEREPIVLLERVDRTFARGEERVRALVDVSFTVAPGELVAFVGPSGCGKSTLLNLVAGVDVADRGRVVVCGREIATATESELVRLRRDAIGVVFQAFHLMPTLTAEENVALPLALAGRLDRARARALVERVGLAERARHHPSELSGGEQQRVAIARALVHRPRVLVADEPTGNLDSTRGEEILGLIDELRREEGAAVLLATHDRAVASRADRVIYMRDGRIEREERA